MTRYTCPSCGAELTFRSSISVYAVCSYCQSTVLRTDVDVTQIGAMAALPDEISPLQIGTTLVWHGSTFTLAGRLRIGWADGAWTEWFIDDGARTQAWLTEAQGLLAVSLEQALPPELTAALPNLGETITLGSLTLRVTDIKQGTCLGSEGELPFAAPQGRTATYLDLTGAHADYAGLEDSPDGRRLFAGHYYPFDELHFANLREVEDWPRTDHAPDQAPDHALDPRYV